MHKFYRLCISTFRNVINRERKMKTHKLKFATRKRSRNWPFPIRSKLLNPKNVKLSFPQFFLWEEVAYLPKVFFLLSWATVLIFNDTNTLVLGLVFLYSCYSYIRVELTTTAWNRKLRNVLVWNRVISPGGRDKLVDNIKKFIFLCISPIMLSFLVFIIITMILIYLYIDFFFEPVVVWNGYFSKTINSFFFTSRTLGFTNAADINIDYFVALDGLNVWLLWLTSLLVFLCSLFLVESSKNDTFFLQMGWIFLLEFAAFQFFCVANYLWMYIFFELSLLPIFILIVFWGSNR